MEEVKNIFKPEFINRIDDIIVFHPLEKEEIKSIVYIMVKTLSERVKESMNITITFTEDAIEEIVKKGYNKAYGARPLRRALQTEVENLLAEEFLGGTIKRDTKVSVGIKVDTFVLNTLKDIE